MSMNHPTCASGFCRDCNETHTLGEGNARLHAQQLMDELKQLGRIDYLSAEKDADPRFNLEYLRGEARGQMFGVLECEDAQGEKIVLRAFSCQYNAVWDVPGWAPPLIDLNQYEQIMPPIEKKIKQLGREMDDLEKGCADWRQKKAQRKQLSQQLMRDMHSMYSLTNLCGERRQLPQAFASDKGIPAGCGDCCAPKLLNQAAQLGLKPLGLTEFFIGRTNRSASRHHGEFYSACESKCQPILGFLLCDGGKGILPTYVAAEFQLPKTEEKVVIAKDVLNDGRLKIIYEEQDFVVVAKASGLLSVPGKGAENFDCVSNRIAQLYEDCIEQPSVHRLDMDTSGLLVLGLTKQTHRALSIQFQKRSVQKTYIALLDGQLKEESGSIELPFRLDEENRPRQIYDEVKGKMGLTHWRNLGIEGDFTRIEMKPVTGRTHQLRLHCSHAKGLNISIVGDPLYGRGTGAAQLKLHAAELSFFHPHSGERLSFSCPAAF